MSQKGEGKWDKISIWKDNLRFFNTEKRYIPIDKQDKYKEHNIYHSQIMKHKDKIRNKVKEKWEIIRRSWPLTQKQWKLQKKKNLFKVLNPTTTNVVLYPEKVV